MAAKPAARRAQPMIAKMQHTRLEARAHLLRPSKASPPLRIIRCSATRKRMAKNISEAVRRNRKKAKKMK